MTPPPTSARTELRLFGSAELSNAAGNSLLSVLAQPKLLALLTYLVLAQPRGFHRRDTLLALFWPESDAEHARTALRKALYRLRRALGAAAIINRGDDEVAVPEAALWCDAVALEDAFAAGCPDEVLRLYRGDLLPGFYLTGALEFEQWLERQRDRLRRIACDASSARVAALAGAGRLAEAVEWAHRALSVEPQNEPALQRLLLLLEQRGDYAAAVQAYEQYRRLLENSYSLTPGATTAALIARIRAAAEAERHTTSTREVGHADAAMIHSPAATMPAEATLRPGRTRAWQRLSRHAGALALLVLGVVAGVLALTILPAQQPTAAGSVFAIGEVRDRTGADSAAVAAALADLLATNLSRAEGIEVISPARVHELAGAARPTRAAAALLHAARRAGAQQLVEGSLFQLADGTYQFDVRRIRVADARVVASHSVTGSDVFTLVDGATAELLRGLLIPAADLRVADVTTHSAIAYALYQKGLRAFYQGNAFVAFSLLRAALEEDSTFAMAAYYASIAGGGDGDAAAYLERAVRLAQRAPDRERLLIRWAWAHRQDDPAALALADTLVRRYPRDAEGHLALGVSLDQAGDFHAAAAHLRRVIDMDAGGLDESRPRCLSCGAVRTLVMTYLRMDSADAALRLARTDVARHPASVTAWGGLAWALQCSGRYAEARAAWQTLAQLAPELASPDIAAVSLSLMSGDFASADQILYGRIDGISDALSGEALWWRVLSLRYQGRLRDARDAALRLREQAQRERGGAGPPAEALPLAAVLYDLGDYDAAAAITDSLARHVANGAHDDALHGHAARDRAWRLTLSASARAAAQDTTTLRTLAERVAALGARSLYGRDQRLHHHIRGLLHLAAHDDAAAEAAFRQAMYSTTFGYTRTNVELAKLLLAQRRAHEAIPLLEAGLRGSLIASNMYVTHTELRELLGRAYELAGQPGAAAAQYRRVLAAWQHADTSLHARRTSAQQRLADLPARTSAP